MLYQAPPAPSPALPRPAPHPAPPPPVVHTYQVVPNLAAQLLSTRAGAAPSHAFLCLSLLSTTGRLSPTWLLKCCQHKLVLHIERLTRDKDTYMQVRSSIDVVFTAKNIECMLSCLISVHRGPG
jgi:hypothetical protein